MFLPLPPQVSDLLWRPSNCWPTGLVKPFQSWPMGRAPEWLI